MSKSRFTNAITSAAVTFLVTGVWVVIPLVFSIVITGILGVFWLFFSTVGWLSTSITITSSIAIISLCLPFIFALVAGIIGFIYGKS